VYYLTNKTDVGLEVYSQTPPHIFPLISFPISDYFTLLNHCSNKKICIKGVGNTAVYARCSLTSPPPGLSLDIILTISMYHQLFSYLNNKAGIRKLADSGDELYDLANNVAY
jgi:hypothetical protein